MRLHHGTTSRNWLRPGLTAVLLGALTVPVAALAHGPARTDPTMRKPTRATPPATKRPDGTLARNGATAREQRAPRDWTLMSIDAFRPRRATCSPPTVCAQQSKQQAEQLTRQVQQLRRRHEQPAKPAQERTTKPATEGAKPPQQMQAERKRPPPPPPRPTK